MVLQVEVSAMEGLVCTCIGNNMASLMGREAAMPARASTRPFSILLIFSIVHSVNRCKVSLTFVRYRVMRASLASYSFWTCLTMSCEYYRPGAWRRIEPERGPIRIRWPHILLHCWRQGIPAGWLAPGVPLLGTVAEARLRTRMIVRLHRLAKSTTLFHLIPGVG